ncbi:MAG: hypothetical protein FGM58_01735 [Acidimicrobiia bacterium]|nr:hypothetical protein [Acidimicrobiia bacterium]
MSSESTIEVPDAVAPITTSWRSARTILTALTVVVAVGLVLWPLLDLARTASGLVWRPSGDWAVIALRTDDVGRLTPLLGPYSRFGWNHPGPLLFWSLSIPYRMLGAHPQSILSAAALLNAVVVVAIAGVAWRRGRAVFVVMTMAAMAILFHALGPVVLRDPWNPYLTLLPLLLLTLLSWSIAEGDRWMWVPFAFVASIEIESHVGYLPMVVVLAVVASVLARARRPRAPMLPVDRRSRTFLLGAIAATLVLCWLPALIDQVAGTGNALAILDYFADPGARPAGLGTALEVMAGQLRIPGAPWLGVTERAGPDGQLLGAPLTALLVPLLAFAAALGFARRRAPSAARLQWTVLALTVGGVVATSRVIGPVFDWIVRWWWIIACLWWLSIAWSLWSMAIGALRLPAGRRALTVGVVAIGLVTIHAGVAPVVTASTAAPAPNAPTSQVLGNFLEPVVDALRDNGPVFVETIGSVRGDYGDAVRYALERAGVDVAVGDDLITHYGPQRDIARRGTRSTVWVVSADAIGVFRGDASMVELGGWDPLGPDERRAFEIDRDELQSQLRAIGRDDLALALTNGGGGVDSAAAGLDGVDQALLQRVERIRRRGDPVAVFIGPAPTR